MCNKTSITTRLGKAIGLGLLALVAVTVAVNELVRVFGPGDRSMGIVRYWADGVFLSANFRNWETSAEYSEVAVEILVQEGSSIIEETLEGQNARRRAIQYLNTALQAARKIDDDYLAASHPLLPEAYRNYKESLRLFLSGAETKDLQRFREATPLYNGFLAFMEAHKDEFKRIR